MFGISRAPEINRPGLVWFNTPSPLSLADLRGRVVILDFWTYCCINCIQVIPTLQMIEERFPTEVAVIGVHSPKFAAERLAGNVAQAIARYGIGHPVVHDPAMSLWQDYGVRAWPTLVFLSPDGYVIGQLPGEPNPDALIPGIGDMVRQFMEQGELSPAALPRPSTDAAGGRLCFPGKIKACPGPAGEQQWAVADAGHHQIVVFDDGGKEVVRYGSGNCGFADGSASAATFHSPQGLTCDSRSIWVADTGNHALRRIDRETGSVTTLAGLGRRGAVLRHPEPGEGTPLASPWDLEKIGRSLYFANAGSHQIGRYDMTDGSLRPIAGTGGENIVDGSSDQALLAQPSGLAAGPGGGTLYFADAETSSIRLLQLEEPPRVKTLVGQGLFAFGHQNGVFDQALLQHPLGVAVGADMVLVADSYNGILRRLDLASRQVEDVPMGECQDRLCRPLNEPAGVAIAGPNRVLVSDTNNHRIVEIDRAAGVYRTWAE